MNLDKEQQVKVWLLGVSVAAIIIGATIAGGLIGLGIAMIVIGVVGAIGISVEMSF
jgi:hypothetical protein